jgi:SAM-dependent methyltransferase
MRFTKYDTKQAYHWREYVRGTKYRRHADKVKRWVKEKNVLDVGAGDGLITYLLRAKGIEYEPTAVKIAQTLGVDVVEGDAYNLPYADNSFEAVTMIDVIEHFEHPLLAVKEAFRVAPVLYIATPERGMVNDPFHYQEWLADELVDFLKDYKLEGQVEVVPEHKSMYAKFTK